LNQDLTYGKNFSTFLGSFWSSLFDNGAMGSAIGYASSEMLSELYLDVLDTINSSSIYDIPVFKRKNVYPLVISESKINNYSELPGYGSGGNYGSQNTYSTYETNSYLEYGKIARLNFDYIYPISDSVSRLAGVAVNRLFNPSVTLVNDSDFLLRNNKVFFRKNPFDNDLIPKRTIQDPITGKIDREIVIWFCEVDQDVFQVYQKYGFIITNAKKSTEQYKSVIQKIFEILSRGSSYESLYSYLSVISGCPVVTEPYETIEDISDTPDGRLVITDKNVYSLDQNINTPNDVFIGATIKAGTPIGDTVKMYDIKKRGWWSDLQSIPLRTGLSTNTSGFISFPNAYELGVYAKKQTTSQYSTGLYFTLIGQTKYVDEFWEKLRKKSTNEKNNWGYSLFKKYSNSKTDADFVAKKDIFLNPAEIFCEDLFKDNILPIKIKLNNVKNFDIFFKAIDPLEIILPVNCILMLFFDVSLVDEVNISNNYSNSLSIDLSTVINLNLNNLPNPSSERSSWLDYKDKNELLEMISIDSKSITQKAGKFYKNSFNSSDTSRGILIDKFDLSIINNLVENVEIKQIPKCAII